MSNGLDQDQDLHFVSPDLGQKLLVKVINRRQNLTLARKELTQLNCLLLKVETVVPMEFINILATN